MLQDTSSLVTACGGADAASAMLRTTQDLCHACGGAEALAALLKLLKDLVATFGGPERMAGPLQELSALLAQLGGAEEFAALLNVLRELAGGLGGAAGLTQILRDLSQVITGAGGPQPLVRRLLADRGGGEGMSDEERKVCNCVACASQYVSLHNVCVHISDRASWRSLLCFALLTLPTASLSIQSSLNELALLHISCCSATSRCRAHTCLCNHQPDSSRYADAAPAARRRSSTAAGCG